MDITIWIDGEETLRTRNMKQARTEYRKALRDRVTVEQQGIARYIAAFDEAAKTPGVFGVEVGAVGAMFHR